MHQIDESNLEKFSFFVPATLEKGSKSGVEEMRVKGIASSLAEDTDGQTLDPAGFDFTPLLNRGFFNWDHQAKQRASAIIGEVDFAELRNNNRDFYIEGFLYPDSDDAKDVYKLAKILEKNSKKRRLGFSIEGVVLEKDPINPNWIKRARIIHVAITPMPKNPNTLMQVMKGETAAPLMMCEYDCDITKAYEEIELEKGGPGSGRRKTQISFKDLLNKLKISSDHHDEVTKIFNDREKSDAQRRLQLTKLVGKDASKHINDWGQYDGYYNPELQKAMSAEVGQEQGTIPEHIAGTKNPNKMPLEDGEAKTCPKCDHDQLINGKCLECGYESGVGKVINKSDIYNLIAGNYTTDVIIANEIFSLIKGINQKLFNMTSPITLEAVNKAFEFLQKGTEAVELENLTKGEGANPKDEYPEGSQEPDESEDLEKACNMAKGFDPKMSKADMKNELMKGGFSEATADSAASIVAEASANKDGGNISAVTAPVINKGEENIVELTSIENQPSVDVEGLIKSVTATLIQHSDRKFQNLGTLLKYSEEQNTLLKGQLDQLSSKVEAALSTPQPRKSITAAPVERFVKGQEAEALANGTDVYDLTKADDVASLGERLFNEAIVLRENGTPNQMLEKAVADLDISKSIPSNILPYLKAKNIAVRMGS